MLKNQSAAVGQLGAMSELVSGGQLKGDGREDSLKKCIHLCCGKPIQLLPPLDHDPVIGCRINLNVRVRSISGEAVRGKAGVV